MDAAESTVAPATDALPGDVLVEPVSCPMGCPAGATEVARGTDRQHGFGGTFPVLRCDTCGLMRTDPRPTMPTIGAYYPQNYGPYQGAPADETAPGLLERLLMALRWDGTKHLVPPVVPGRVLEVGCASGQFLRKLRRRGWTVRGIEPSAEAAERATRAGFAVHNGPLETAPPPVDPLDLVVASHAFEHLHDPLGSFRRLRDWSKPGAFLSCAVPDASSILFGRFRGAWYDLDVPRHLFHYTPATLTALLAKAGWRVERVRPERTLNGWVGSIGYWLRDRGRGTSALGDRFLAFPDSASPLKRLTVPLSFVASALAQTGRMVVWARADTVPI